jgi:hypothetical protein
MTSDANDLVGPASAIDVLADGIGGAEEPVGEGFVDDRDARAVGVGGLRTEVAAGEARRTERVEIAGRNHVEVSENGGIGLRGVAVDGEPVAAVAAGEQGYIGANGGVDAGQSGCAFAQLREEGSGF